MGIPITGLFEPSGGAGAFDLYSPADIEAGNINVILQAIAGGAFKGGSHATSPVGEVVIQVKTTTGAPGHSASLGTPCWNSIDLLLYVNNNGSTGWTLVGPGGGGSVATDAIWDALGDLVYGTGADTGAKLAGNITTTKKFLGQTGDGAVSAAPVWATILDADLPATIARDSELHTILTIGADVAHSLAGQVLSAVLAGAAQVGHVGTGAQSWNGVKTFGSRPLLPASSPSADNEATRKKYVDDEIDADIATHAGAADPHTGYLKESDSGVKDAASGYAGLSAGSKLALAQMQEVMGYADLTDDLAVLKSLLTTRGDMIRRGASAPERFALGTSGKFWKAGATDPDWQWDEAAIEYVIDGGGSAIPTGSAGGLVVPFKCFVTGWTVHATGGQTGAITIDVNYHATTVPASTSIAGTEKPTIASGSEGENLSLSSWTQALAKGGSLTFDVDSNGGSHERVVVCLYVDKQRAS